jgi:hypothetical protein
MYIIDSDKSTGVIVISGSYIPTTAPTFSATGQSYSLSFVNLANVEKFGSFEFTTLGTNDSRFLDTSYRVSRDGNNWTAWIPLESNITNFPPFDPKDKMFIDVNWNRVGDSPYGLLTLTKWSLKGIITRNLVDGESTVKLTPENKEIIIKPPFIYKVFKITDLEIISTGDIQDTTIKYRFSQDYGRTVTQWEPLTKENITTVKINPIRFFQIEYLIDYTGTSNVNIYDINLIGDFQNVTQDSAKTNLYGLRENCNCLKLQLVGDESTDVAGISNLDGAVSGIMSSSNCDTTPIPTLTKDDITKLYQPYQQTQAINLLNNLSNTSVQIFGWDVVYFLTDPDRKGIDFTFHEYQLYNYVCSEMIKVSVDGNNFPDNQISMNQFDLSLFDNFEIHITKENFKKVFGVEKRPSKEDFLWFCELNRMFQVEHAQQYRGFNNSAVYYKIMLKKYVQKSNIIAGNQTIAEKVKELTKNSTIDELFGVENTLDKKDVANEEQFRPLTRDVLRLKINVDIDKELIENSTNIISKTNYDLSSATIGTVAVEYREFRQHFRVSDNIGFFLWFNLKNYTVNDLYNFFTYYDTTNNLGFKINLQSDRISVNLNTDAYNFDLGTFGNSDALIEDTWYAYLVNVDQRQRKLSQFIYKRNVDDESQASKLGKTLLKKVYSQTSSMTPVEFEFDSINATILASDMKVTNIRMFNDVIPDIAHNKLLNQAIIGDDYRNLIFADSANTRIVLPKMPLSQPTNLDTVRGEFNKENLQ